MNVLAPVLPFSTVHRLKAVTGKPEQNENRRTEILGNLNDGVSGARGEILPGGQGGNGNGDPERDEPGIRGFWEKGERLINSGSGPYSRLTLGRSERGTSVLWIHPKIWLTR